MTSRALTLALTATLLAPAALFAVPSEGPPRGFQARAEKAGPARAFLPPPGYLQLDEAQREQTQAILGQLRGDLEPLRQEQQALRETIRTELEGDQPSASAIGDATIALHALRDDFRTTLEAAEADFVLILDQEQQTKWENYRLLGSLRRSHRGGPGSGPGPDVE